MGVVESLDAETIGEHADRGQSMSVFVLAVTAALIVVIGLVVDGGQQVTAVRHAQTTAAAAARAAADEAAASTLAGERVDAVAVRRAGERVLAEDGVPGGVQVSGRVVQVWAESRRDTLFLSLIGIGSVTGRGSARAELVVVG